MDNFSHTQLNLFRLIFPISNYVTLVFLAMVIVLMAYLPDMVYSLYIGPVWILFLYIGYKLKGPAPSKDDPSKLDFNHKCLKNTKIQ